MSYSCYAVKKGYIPGIYFSWDECKKNVNGFPNAEYKGFKAESDAREYLSELFKTVEKEKEKSNEEKEAETETKKEKKKTPILGTVQVQESPYAFVDGSFNALTGVYGYGGFLVHDNTKEILQGCGCEPEMASMRNVAGEVLGSVAAITEAISLGLKEITIYYDYLGIEMWATGKWKRNKEGTKAYYNFVQKSKEIIQIRFVKTKAHSGVEGNEEADRLAKEAVGIK